jgi:hypothetical protein
MAVSAARVTVSTSAVALNPAESGVAGGRLFVKNTAAVEADVLVLGASDVTASTGFALAAGATLDLPYSYGERVYAIRGASADIVAHVLRLGE